MGKTIKDKVYDGIKMDLQGLNNYHFENVLFTNCTFNIPSDEPVENCTFNNCKFINCITGNMVFEKNVFINCEIDTCPQTMHNGLINNKFINTTITNSNPDYISMIQWMYYNEYFDCNISDVRNLIVSSYHTVKWGHDTEVIVANNAYHNCTIDFNSIIDVAKNARDLSLITRNIHSHLDINDFCLNKYLEPTEYDADFNLMQIPFEQRLYYIVAAIIFFTNINVTHPDNYSADTTLKFTRTEFSDEMKFIMGNKYLDTTMIEPIIQKLHAVWDASINDIREEPLSVDVPNLLDEKYWKPLEKAPQKRFVKKQNKKD